MNVANPHGTDTLPQAADCGLLDRRAMGILWRCRLCGRGRLIRCGVPPVMVGEESITGASILCDSDESVP